VKEELLDSIDLRLLVKTTQEPVRIPTQNPPGSEKGCAEYIHGKLTEWGVESEMVLDPFPQRPQVAAAQVLRKNAARVSGVSTEPFGMLASADVRNFIKDAGIPAVTFGPGDLKQPHTFNESIEIQQIPDCAKILLLSMGELL